jgi:hypothetical protein
MKVKSISRVAVLAMTVSGVLVRPVLAGTPTVTTVVNRIPVPIPDNLKTIGGVIETISGILFPVIGLILFFMIIYGGITKLTAAGDAEKEKKAMQILKNAVIGTVIIVLARVIVDTISAILGLPRL